MQINKAQFVCSSERLSQLPKDSLPEFAFIGRSNVGKSSLVNMLTGRSGLAKVSGTPGKTRLINHFRINDSWYLVDLPGYGYARVSKAEQQRWGTLMETYFALGLLTVGIQIVDIRHKPTRDDVTMADWFRASDKPWIVVANKLDKIKKSQLEGNLAEIRQTLLLPAEVPVIPFSAEKGIGRDEVLAHIYGYIGKEGSEQ